MRVIHDHLTASTLAEPANFTGRVWRTDYLSPAAVDDLRGARFEYEPGARSYWHLHDREQAIVVVGGHGLVAWEGLDRPHLLAPGDWWHVEPEVPHWHGATPETTFAHLAVTAGGGTTWLTEVSAEEYAAAARLVSDTLAEPRKR
jgi:quercetin dioxygenase-like cupin family protein